MDGPTSATNAYLVLKVDQQNGKVNMTSPMLRNNIFITSGYILYIS